MHLGSIEERSENSPRRLRGLPKHSIVFSLFSNTLDSVWRTAPLPSWRRSAKGKWCRRALRSSPRLAPKRQREGYLEKRTQNNFLEKWCRNVNVGLRATGKCESDSKTACKPRVHAGKSITDRARTAGHRVRFWLAKNPKRKPPFLGSALETGPGLMPL